LAVEGGGLELARFGAAGFGAAGFGPASFGPGRSATPAVRVLILACAGIFLLQVVADRFFPFTYWFGLVPAQVARGAVWQLATYVFLHGGILHLLFNLLALWMFGSDVEERMGTARFVRFWFITGIGAGLVAVAFGWGERFPVVGASGAIFGILVAFAKFFPQRPVTLLVMFFLPVTLQARMLVLVYGAIEVMVLAQTGMRGLGQLAHLGGILFGWVALNLPDWSARLKGARERARSERRLRSFRAGDEERRELREEIDRLLGKVSRAGMAGLTPGERRRLVEASERLKRL